MPIEQLIAQGGLGLAVVVLIGLVVWLAREARTERTENRAAADRQLETVLEVLRQNTTALTTLSERLERLDYPGPRRVRRNE